MQHASESQPNGTGGSGAPGVSGRAIYTLFILLLVHVVSNIDRSILGLLLEPIKAEFGFSDTQLGFLSGLAFALFYATLGIPAAWLADRSNRRNFVATACALWSVMTVACGMAQSFVQLALVRVGVAVGEAGGGPPSISILSSLFPRERRARALSVYALAASIGTLIGHPIAGIVSDAWGWRYAFFVVGAPGILVALLVRFTVHEPPRPPVIESAPAAPTMGETLAFIFRSKACRYLLLGCALSTFLAYGLASWVPAYLIRSHGMSPSSIGVTVSPFTGLSGMIGGLLGGYFADHFGRRDPLWTARMIAIAKIVAFPLLLSFFLIDELRFALVSYWLATLFGAVYLGTTYSMIQSIVPLQMRATAAAVQLLMMTLIGMGLGPQIVGILSDALRDTHGSDSLRIALAVFTSMHLPAVVLYWLGARHYKRELKLYEDSVAAAS